MNCETAMMMCEETADGTVSRQDLARLEDHLASCPDCRELKRRLDATRATLRTALPDLVTGLHLPDAARQDILAAARQAAEEKADAPARPRRHLPLLILLAAAAAVAVILIPRTGPRHSPAPAPEVRTPQITAGASQAAEGNVIITVTSREVRPAFVVATRTDHEIAVAVVPAEIVSETRIFNPATSIRSLTP